MVQQRPVLVQAAATRIEAGGDAYAIADQCERDHERAFHWGGGSWVRGNCPLVMKPHIHTNWWASGSFLPQFCNY